MTFPSGTSALASSVSPAIEARELYRFYHVGDDETQALRGVSMEVNRGEIVAELTPPGHGSSDPSVPPGITALARRGLATVGASANASLYRALPRKGPRKITSAQLLDAERGSR